MSIAIPADTILDENSAYHRLNDIAGIHVDKSLTLNGNGATTTNIFQVTGSVRAIKLFGYCTEATDSTTLSNFKWELDDGTAQSDITGVVNASGAVAGAILMKTATAAGATQFINPSAGVVTDAGSKSLFEPFLLTQKTGGVNTYVRISYTGDATSDTDWTFEVHYSAFGENASIVAV
jgi:hypothetical protein